MPVPHAFSSFSKTLPYLGLREGGGNTVGMELEGVKARRVPRGRGGRAMLWWSLLYSYPGRLEVRGAKHVVEPVYRLV